MCYNLRVGLDSPIAGTSAQFFYPHKTGGLMPAETLNEGTLGKIVQFVFTQKSKSDLGGDFLVVVETGREKDYTAQEVVPPQEVAPPQDPAFWQTAKACRALVLDGSGERIHADLVVSAARMAALAGRERT
jgi:hypothetical protein